MKIRNPTIIKWIGFLGALIIRCWIGTLSFRCRCLGKDVFNDRANTYLATFQALGGLGLLLGAAGLAVVLLRSVWERRGELALLRALGFRKGALAWLVLAENLFLLVAGLGVGTLAALAAVAPHLTDSGAGMLWLRLVLLLGLVVGVGLVAGLAAAWGSLRTPVLTALRRE